MCVRVFVCRSVGVVVDAMLALQAVVKTLPNFFSTSYTRDVVAKVWSVDSTRSLVTLLLLHAHGSGQMLAKRGAGQGAFRFFLKENLL